MYSLNWPNIFTNAKTNLLQDKEAAKSNLRLVVASEKEKLFGDPYFGTTIRKYMFSQISQPFADLIVDQIYTAIRQYVPQIYCKRENIQLISERGVVYVEIKCQYIYDRELDTYTIELMENQQ